MRSSAELPRHRVAERRPWVRHLDGARAPDVPAFADGVARAIEPLPRREEGGVVVLEVGGWAGPRKPCAQM